MDDVYSSLATMHDREWRMFFRRVLPQPISSSPYNIRRLDDMMIIDAGDYVWWSASTTWVARTPVSRVGARSINGRQPASQPADRRLGLLARRCRRRPAGLSHGGRPPRSLQQVDVSIRRPPTTTTPDDSIVINVCRPGRQIKTDDSLPADC